MNELLEASLRFPTVVFTIGLGIALIYWLFVLVGALDIDVLGGADSGDAITGGAKGAAEGLKGIKLEGSAEGGFWQVLGLCVVPITITVSSILLVGWCGSLLVMHYGAAAFGMKWLPMVTLPAILIVAVLVTSILVRPLAPVFAIKEGKTNRDYVGQTCTISTGHVDEGFGQAVIVDGGIQLDLPVRCDRTGNLARGDKALIIDFDDDRQAYVVTPTADMLTSDKVRGEPS
ncbi:MAG: hypothetical protein M3680_21955 [Myxococcota bacterium]|nr:hypothetical protein [Myxococcota bacterium]